MKDKSLQENFSELNDIVKNYINTRINLWKVTLIEKVAKAGTYLFSTIFVLVAVLFVLLLLTFAFSFWYGKYHGEIMHGFLISAGFFIVLAVVAFILRKPLFTNNIVKNIASIIFDDDTERVEK